MRGWKLGFIPTACRKCLEPVMNVIMQRRLTPGQLLLMLLRLWYVILLKDTVLILWLLVLVDLMMMQQTNVAVAAQSRRIHEVMGKVVRRQIVAVMRPQHRRRHAVQEVGRA